MSNELRWSPGHVAVGDDTVYYEVTEEASGASPLGTIVLGHGGAGSHAVWFQQVPVLARHARVITWDTRGFGGSTLTGSLDAETAASDLAAVLDAVGVAEPVHIVGQSMGGWWLSAFALGRPERVRSLTYCNTAGGAFTPEVEAHFAAYMAAGGPPSSSRLGDHFAIGPSTDATRTFLYQQLNTLSPGPGAAVAGAVAARYDPAALRVLEIPILVIGATDDPIFTPALLAGVADAMGGRFVCIDGAGHSPYFEQPEAFNDALQAFLTALR